MKIYIASDHAGFGLKQALIPFLTADGHDVHDLGPSKLDPDDDYPVYMKKLAEALAKEPDARGIGIGKSGQGEAMALNRHHKVRAAVYYGGLEEILTLSREHNDANALALGAAFVFEEEARDAVRKWLAAPFPGDERHLRRIRLLA